MGRFHREYLLRLPLPLAQLYGRANNAKDACGRHDNAFYLFEALIKLTATPLIAAYRQEIAGGAKRDPELDRLRLSSLDPAAVDGLLDHEAYAKLTGGQA